MGAKAIGAVALAVLALGEARALEPAASFAAAKKVHVYCKASDRPLGFVAYPGSTRIDVSAAKVCRPLLRWQDAYSFSFALMVLAHEAQHSGGVADETDATCRAIALLPALVQRYFPLRGRATIREVVQDARAARLSLGDTYNSRPC